MIIWLLTAVAALIVTVVYFGELQELYSTVKTIEETKQPSGPPSGIPTQAAAGDLQVTPEPTAEPTPEPTPEPTEEPTAEPTPEATPTPEIDLTEHAYYYDPTIDQNKPIIALSFDDGPSSHTDRILAALQKYGVKATFFMVGYEIDSFQDQVHAVYEAGCEVANHTLDHANLKTLGKDEIRRQVYDNEKKLNKIVPVGEVVVRPPYGNVNDTVKAVVERPMFNWSVDSLDWKTKNADSVVAQIKQDARDGYIILMHDLYESTAEATERIIPWLLEQGYQITCISNMFEARGEEVLPGHVYRYVSPAPAE